MTNQTLLRILEHLAYVIECIAEIIPGEAKTELNNLISDIVKDTNIEEPEKALLLTSFNEALGYLKNKELRYSAAVLSGQSRRLWKQVSIVE